jgi:hypothetical protein
MMQRCLRKLHLRFEPKRAISATMDSGPAPHVVFDVMEQLIRASKARTNRFTVTVVFCRMNELRDA